MFLELLLCLLKLYLIHIVSLVDRIGPSSVDSQHFLPVGFADIPTGKTSPYVLRRTTMPTRTSPRLAAQKLTPSPLSLNKENHTETSKPTAGGSRSQKVNSGEHVSTLPNPGSYGVFWARVWHSAPWPRSSLKPGLLSPCARSKPGLRTVGSGPGDKHYIILRLQSHPWSDRPLTVWRKMLNNEKLSIRKDL